MNQPELGHLIATTRSNCNLSQESLAEACDISARTVQRIEKGTVVPHAFTLQSICRELDIQINADGKSENTLWLAIIHFSSMFLMLPVPLFIWAWKGSSDALLAQQSKQALNFQLTWTIAIFAWFGICTAALFLLNVGTDAITWAHVIGWGSAMWFVGPVIFGLFITYYSIINMTRSISMKEIHYPLSIRFWK